MITFDWTWGLAAASLVGTIANIKKRRWCFAVWMFTNATWAIYDWSIGAHGQGTLQFVYFLLAIWGWFSWGGGQA